MNFLDKQNMFFVDTADCLSRISRETLLRARLPNFHIPAAVEVLTTGAYDRLPSIIRQKIVPPDPITPLQKQQTLLRLNQVIQYRLVTGNLIPQMRRFKINTGRVTFIVEHEFEVSLTVMGDGPNVPWRLLDIEILVEDKETGDGKALLHSRQVHYIHSLIQARLVENPNALVEVYNCLHFFCQSLQLEVLYTQTLRLKVDRLDDNIKIDEYVPGVKLTVSYWRELTTKDPKSDLGYKLTVHTDQTDPAKTLCVVHIPSIGQKESTQIADRAIHTDHLSMERLIVHTIYIRSCQRLTELKSEFLKFLKHADFLIQGTPAILTIQILYPCLRAEQVHITVDTHTGMLKCHVPKHLDCPIIPELQLALNGDFTKLSNLVTELRYWITHKRCEKTLQHLPAVIMTNLPFLNQPTNPLMKPGRQRLFVKLKRHPQVILIVHLKEKEGNSSEIEYTFHLGFLNFISQEDPVEGQQQVPHPADIPKFFTKVTKLVEFDTFVATHGPGTHVDDIQSHKRKLVDCVGQPPSKMAKTIYPAYFIPELAHVVAMCDEKIPFLTLSREFSKRNIPHSGLQVEANATSLVLKLLTMPKPTIELLQRSTVIGFSNMPQIDDGIWNDLVRRVLSVSVRSQARNNTRSWVVEFVFFSTPLPSSNHREQGNRRAVYLTYDQSPNEMSRTVDEFLRDWSRIVFLYMLVYKLAEDLKSGEFLRF